MIDTIKVFIPHSDLPPNYYDSHFLYFSNRKITRTEDNEFWGSATFKNFFLQYTKYGLSIEGSLTKYYYGTNQHTLNYFDFTTTIEQLSIELGLNLKECQVSRIDLAENILVTKPVANYYKYFGDAKSLNRVVMNNGLEYRNTNRGIIIYDKIKELRSNQVPLIPLFQGQKIMRIEYRLKNPRTISKALGIDKTLIADLYVHYPKLQELWTNSFNSIYKNHDMVVFKNETYIQRDMFKKQLIIAGINNLGGGQYILDIIKEARKEKLFAYPNQASNLLRQLKRLMQLPVLTQKSTLVSEIEKKAKVVAQIALLDHHVWGD